MSENEEGFSYPVVDERLCVGCGLCEETCHLAQPCPQTESETWAAAWRDDAIMASASGGVFAALAQWMIRRGGVVAGCAYDEQMIPRHMIAREVSQIRRLQGSKYVESDLDEIYTEVRELLRNGTPVLFSGTGCQVAGLKGFLGKEHERLYTVDIICHGVPSRALFRKHIEWLSRRDRVTGYCFRSKQQGGWGEYRCRIERQSDRAVDQPYYEDAYYRRFMAGDCYRESCYRCRYANLNRVSDLTIGDFWGVEEISLPLNREKGVSIVLVNTPKGRRLLQEEPSLWKEKVPVAAALQKQSNLIHPTVRPAGRDRLIHLLRGNGYRRYAQSVRLYRAIRRMIPDALIDRLRNRGGHAACRERES